MTKYDEMVEKAAEKFGHCRVAGGLDDHDIARQVLEAIGITRESVETPPEVVATGKLETMTAVSQQDGKIGAIEQSPEPVAVTDKPAGTSPQE